VTAALAIHDPNCSTWDAPAESGADHLVAIGYHDERIAAYLSTLRPVYDAMKRCLGQMAGLLLLLQTRCLDSHRAGVTHDAMREILAELSDRLRALKAPEGAQRHFRGLEALVRQLEAGAEQLNRQNRTGRQDRQDLCHGRRRGSRRQGGECDYRVPRRRSGHRTFCSKGTMTATERQRRWRAKLSKDAKAKRRAQRRHAYAEANGDAYFTCPEAVICLLHLERQYLPHALLEPCAGDVVSLK
jgi:hypothetical protein